MDKQTMSKSNREKKKGKLKAGVEELVGPLLNDLKEAESDAGSTEKPSITKMVELVEKTKCVLKHRENWDSDLIDFFEQIQRKIEFLKNNQQGSEHVSSRKEESIHQQTSSKNKNRSELTWEVLVEDLEDLLEKELKLINIECAPDASASEDSSKVGKPSSIGSSQGNNNRVEYPAEWVEKLTPLQRDCLYSLGIFPKYARLKKRLLLYWWIGMGLVPLMKDTKTTTDKPAEDFFSSLEDKGILQPIHIRKHNKKVNWCTIHPTIHEHLIIVCKDLSSIDIDRGNGQLVFFSKEESGIALFNNDQQYLNSEDIVRKISKCNNTIHVAQFGNWHCTDLELSNVISETRSIDHIEVDETKFLTKLGENVTFLSLRGISGIEELPESIGELGDLRILDLEACHNLEKLPQKPWSKLNKILGLVPQKQKWFKNLTYLDMSKCCLLDHIPRWVCKLYELSVLKGFVATSGVNDNQFCQLRDLSKLKKLRKLTVKIVKHFNVEDFSGLKSLDNLSILTIIWVTNHSRESNVEMQSSNVNGRLPKAGNQREENVKNNIKVSGYEGEQIRIGKTENQSTYIVQGSDRIHGEEGIATANKVQDVISFPKNLEKLDIRSCPESDARKLLNPENFLKLTRLYIRGGNLKKIRISPGWVVQTLRLRYLKFLDLNWYHLKRIFPELKYVEFKECSNLKWFPKEESSEGPFPSTFEDPNPELLIDGQVKVTITRNKTAPLTRHKQMMMLELIGCNSISDRPGLDLVVILDVSKNMNEYLLKELKTAILFVIRKLSSSDRLSIITVSDIATEVYPLRQVTKTCQKDAENLVISLNASSSFSTNIFQGLQMGSQIIKDHNNSGSVSSIMLFSGSEVKLVDDPNIDDVAIWPIHTFGLWYNQDPQVLKDIAYKSMGGTFSDVSSPENLTKAVSECLAGLLTVVVQDLTLTISPINQESTLELVSVGRYHNPQSKGDPNSSVTVRFGDLYSEEVHKILVELQLPATDKPREPEVVKISCSYKILETPVTVIVSVSRMDEVSGDQQPQPKVIAEMKHQEIAEMIRKATKLADDHQLENAWKVLMDALKILKNLVEKDANELFESMKKELQWLMRKMILRDEYMDIGRRAFAYSFLNSHDTQRTTVRGCRAETSLTFSTPAMQGVLEEAGEFRRSNMKDSKTHLGDYVEINILG